jgi:hypothetical protein
MSPSNEAPRTLGAQTVAPKFLEPCAPLSCQLLSAAKMIKLDGAPSPIVLAG